MRRLSKSPFVAEDYRCPVCSYVFPVYRNSGMQRPAGHLKRLYCVKCKKKLNFKKVDL